MTTAAGRFPELADRGVLITGGASGIGAALVEGFAREGARVAFIDIADTEGTDLVEALRCEVRHAPLFLKADLAEPDQIRAAVRSAEEAHGPVRVLINNAARDDRQDADEVTPEVWDESLAVNLRQVFLTAQAVVPGMRASGGGAIVNFSSIAFLLNMGELPAYATAKAGIIGLTKSLAGRYGPDNIRVNALLPGMVVTERQKRLWITDETIAAMIERQCLKRALGPKDMLGPCLYLASDLSAGMTAQTMIVDGGNR
ncbi:SDR family NAD(P)-dependent oxidoreductase [Ensifer soli]|uniref:SDR family NAD(P)-dependent oxidoreductase n=1 Tax=Ciceribacter sp. sgz301302 TaxID=3342379 RepID=UPI0035B7CE0F